MKQERRRGSRLKGSEEKIVGKGKIGAGAGAIVVQATVPVKLICMNKCR